MLRDMTDSRRIDQHVQAQKPVCTFRHLCRRPALTGAMLDAASSYHHLATFLAAPTNEQLHYARTVQRVRGSVSMNR